MRNVWFPGRLATYTTGTEKQQIKLGTITPERDYGFDLVEYRRQQKLERKEAAARKKAEAQLERKEAAAQRGPLLSVRTPIVTGWIWSRTDDK